MRTRAGVAAVLFMMMAIAVPASAAGPQGTKAVLMLHTYGPNRPFRMVVDAALARVVLDRSDPLLPGVPFAALVTRFSESLARLANRLAGNPSLRIPRADGVQLPRFDWRQLKRWDVDQHQLPPHSDVRFREVTFWDQHQWAAIVMVSVVVIQSALISGLLFQRARRRRAEGALRDTESALRVSDRQVQSLAGRLITAQEAERARIARELHDDLSQKLALLSIELEQFVGDGAASDTVKRQARAASARAAEIATDVHNLSHELHPARLEMLGLAPALRGLCDEMSSGHNIEIEFERAPIPGSIPYEVSLCLFRVAQEGLRNVIKHSGARRATVTLWHADGLLALQIADSGCGFASERDGDGLGLVSMRERALVVGAQFMVQSHQGRGTRLAVTVPVTWVGAPASEALPATGRRAAVVPPLRRRA